MQPAYPHLLAEHVPTRERLEAFAQQEALELPRLQTIECMYVDRMRPLDPPVMHFLASIQRDQDEPSEAPRVQVEEAYWNPVRMSGFAEDGAPVHWGLSLLANSALAVERM